MSDNTALEIVTKLSNDGASFAFGSRNRAVVLIADAINTIRERA